MSLITLTTDFGSGDYALGQVRGVIWQIAPEARLVDLTHEIPPQDILAAQVVLDDCASYFPEGSIHMVVVDPGVGTDRRPIAARLGTHYFVGPDNGLITPLLEKAEAEGGPVEIAHTNRQQYWLPQISSVFHGRDIFAPIAAHLARGVPLFELGERIDDPVRAGLPQPQALEGGWRGQVIDVDHFGNLGVNLKAPHLGDIQALEIRIAGAVIQRLSRTFGDGQPGELVAMIDSSNRLSICVVNGSAADLLGAQTGTIVEVFQIKSAR